jgi:YD repeat-containing protein
MARTAHPASIPHICSRGLLLALCLILLLTGNIRAQTSNEITYIYDELGRLVGLVDPTGETVTYTYDAVGNVLSISRRSSAQVSIIEFTPNSGAIGTAVTIYGTGFSAIASENTVRFNGVVATVASSNATRIVTSVPAGATTGPISVTTPTGTASSTASFIIGNPKAPTVTSFTPTIGLAGTAVTINGTNFDTTPSSNRVTFNNTRSVVSSATATSIATNVPSGATSGHISVTTPLGKGVSSGDFFIPPSPFTAADVEATGRMAIGESKAVTISAPNKIAMILFEGNVGQRVSLQMSGVTIGTNSCCSSRVSIYNPDGTALISPSYVGTSGGFFDTKVLPSTGSYTILIDPESTSTGSLTLTLYNVPPDTSAPIIPGGASVPVATTVPGQNAKLTFNGSAGQRVSLKMEGVTIGTNSCCSSRVSIYNPDGTALISPSYIGTSGGFFDTQTLPADGTYTILVDPESANTGGMTLTLVDVPQDVTNTIMPGGSSVTITTTTAGQNARLTFSGSAGQRVSLKMDGVTIGTNSCCSSRVSIYNPDGTALISPSYVGTGGGFFDTKTLLAAGTYTILIDPEGSNIGSMTLTLYDVPADVNSSIIPDAQPVTVSTTVAGQNATATFNGIAGQRISLRMTSVTIGTSSCCSSRVSILNPDGTTLISPSYIGTGGGFFDTQTLSANGTYTILVDPEGANTGSMTLTLYDVPDDIVGTATVGGSPANIATTVAGQNAKVTFEGTSGQQITVHITGNTMSWVRVTLLKPDGTSLTSSYSPAGSFDLTTQILPVTGTYTISVNPDGLNTGSISVSVTNP